MCMLKLTNNPCKFCNGEIDEGKPLCGDLVDLGDVCCMVKAKEGFDLEYWKTLSACILSKSTIARCAGAT